MKTVAVARNAMATRFEIVLHGEDEVALRATGEAALDEIERLDGQLSLFRETSEIAHVNARAALEPVRVSPPVFALLRRAQALSRETDGAFDVTLAPLMRCWGFHRGAGRVPDAEELARVRQQVGWRWMELDEAQLTVRFARLGMRLDLGAFGKGYAVDCAIEVIRDTGATRGFVHGGTSSAYGLGAPPGAEHWTVALPRPELGPQLMRPGATGPPDGPETPFMRIALRDEALSVSGAVMAAVTGPCAADTDALSTALLVLGESGRERLAARRPGLRTWVIGANMPGTKPEA